MPLCIYMNMCEAGIEIERKRETFISAHFVYYFILSI